MSKNHSLVLLQIAIADIIIIIEVKGYHLKIPNMFSHKNYQRRHFLNPVFWIIVKFYKADTLNSRDCWRQRRKS